MRIDPTSLPRPPHRQTGETDCGYTARVMLWLAAVTDCDWLALDEYAELIGEDYWPRLAAVGALGCLVFRQSSSPPAGVVQLRPKD